MALNNDDIQAIANLLAPIKEDIQSMKEDIQDIKKDIAEIKTTVNQNYDKLSEFYVMQKEHNTAAEDRIDFLAEKVEVFTDQTIKNTVALKKYRAV